MNSHDNNDILRAEFEAWASHPDRSYDLTRGATGDYVVPETRNTWVGWQAARRQHGSAVQAVGEIRESNGVRHVAYFEGARELPVGTVFYAAPPVVAEQPPAAGNALTDEHRTAVRDALADALGEAYDCTRVWSAWGVGTMGPDDFVLVAEDDERLDELTNAAISAVIAINMTQHSLRAAPQAAQGEGLTDEKLSDLIENAEGMRFYDGEYRIDGSDLMKLARAIAAHTRASDGKDSVIEAARKLVKAKGRYHTELNYTALADALAAMQQAASKSAQGGA